MEVWAGMILGFDNDDETVFAAQRRFLTEARVSTAMVGMLSAIPSTPLYDRLKAAGRLDEAESPAHGTNVLPVNMSREALSDGYVRLMAELYEPKAYFDRVDDLYRSARIIIDRAWQDHGSGPPLAAVETQRAVPARDLRPLRPAPDPHSGSPSTARLLPTVLVVPARPPRAAGLAHLRPQMRHPLAHAKVRRVTDQPHPPAHQHLLSGEIPGLAAELRPQRQKLRGALQQRSAQGRGARADRQIGEQSRGVNAQRKCRMPIRFICFACRRLIAPGHESVPFGNEAMAQ